MYIVLSKTIKKSYPILIDQTLAFVIVRDGEEMYTVLTKTDTKLMEIHRVSLVMHMELMEMIVL